MGVLSKVITEMLNEPVATEPEEDLFAAPRPITEEEMADIPKLPTVGDAAKLHNEIQAHIDLTLSHEAVAAKAERLKNLRKANGAPRCGHVLLNGEPCCAPALKGEEYCRFHGQTRAPEIELPVIEDIDSLQVAYMSVARRLMNKTLDAARAKVLLQTIERAARTLQDDDD